MVIYSKNNQRLVQSCSRAVSSTQIVIHSSFYFSQSKMRFPKNHMLNQYVKDICRRSAVSGYSATHSEHKHIQNAKKPSKNTSHRWDSIA
jgi:hypothetical protein